MKKDLLHLKAPGNWMNDPNGFIYYRGKYHLFYQHFPYAPVWGTMHWGHAVSEDLVHWEHLDIALFPTKSYDQDGVFSGSALEKDGELYLYYSAVHYLETDGENIHRSANENYETSQALVISPDGMQFDNWDAKRQIIPVCRQKELADDTHTRDPKVWKSGDEYYMILGSTLMEQTGRVLFYRSKDGVSWEYVNQHQNGHYGRILECPDLFQVDQQWVFVGSPMYLMEDGLEYPSHAVCTLAQFQEINCELRLPDSYQFVDYGLDLYAPQSNLDEDGRRVMIGWMRMPKAVEQEGEKPWNGMMSLPRVIEVKNSHIFFRVHPGVDAYFSKKLTEVSEIPANVPYRLKAILQEGEDLTIGGYNIRFKDDCLQTDRSQVFAGLTGYRLTGKTPKLSGTCHLDIFVEPNLIEIFINEGQYVLSHVVYDLGDRIVGPVKEIYVGMEQ